MPSAIVTNTTSNSPPGSWGQGSCQWDTQFDCAQDPHGLADNGCVGMNQRCDGNRDCSWTDMSKPSWDEDPDWCAWLVASQAKTTQAPASNTTVASNSPAGSWGQGSCQWDTQFDCAQDPHGLADNGCVGMTQRCDGNRDCSWTDMSKPSWDEDPDWCAWLSASQAPASNTNSASNSPSGSWGQGSCQWDSQFDCAQDPHGLADNGCVGMNQRCDSNRDCSWTDMSKPSWDEDPDWCAWLAANPGN